MRKWLLLLAVLIVAAAVFLISSHRAGLPKAPAQARSNLVLQIQFIGQNNIPGGNTNHAAFENEFGSPEARALESQTLDKLSRAPAVWFKDKLPADAIDRSELLLRPLLDDFLKSQWVFEINGSPGSPEYALAIRLDPNRAQLWQNNLRSLLTSWTKISTQNIPGGWELKKDLPPNLFRVVYVNDWVVIGCGQNELPMADAWAQSRLPSSDGSWLHANVDWPGLAKLFPQVAKLDLPAIEMRVTGTNGNLVLSGNIHLSQPLLPLQKWKVPTQIIHQPLSSFTAVRGFAPWLENQTWARQIGISPEPDQLFIWSTGLMPLQLYSAVPVADAANALAVLGHNLANNTNWQHNFMFPLTVSVTNNRISLQGAPFIGPEVLALHETSGDFLSAQVFPNLPFGKGPPSELLQALDRDNLVFYSWEITSNRLNSLPELTQLGLLLTRHKQLQANAVAMHWLKRLAPSLGTSVTEVTQTAPLELAFTRTAPAGLTAIELMALGNWLEAPNFPGCDLSLPKPRFQQLHRPLKKLSAHPTVPSAPGSLKK